MRGARPQQEGQAISRQRGKSAISRFGPYGSDESKVPNLPAWRSILPPAHPAGRGGRLDRALWVLLIALFTLLLVPGWICCAPPSPSGPNVLVLVVDALRADHMSCYGYDRYTTPRIDEFAARGWIFEQAYAQAPLTPTSVASILTACYPSAHRLVGDHKTIRSNWNNTLLLSSRFDELGWRTACFSANPLICEEWGFDHGFHTFSFTERESAARVNRDLEFWIDERLERSEKFFAYVHYMDPHDPYTPRSNPYHTGMVSVPEGHINPHHFSIREGNGPQLDQPLLEEFISLYDAEILETDREIGLLLDWLRRRGLLETTTIAITADHGEAFLEHGWLKHSSTLYEEMIRIPLIIWDPWRPGGGARIREAVQTIDIVPTLMAACGLPAPESRPGRDLLDPATHRSGTLASTVEGESAPSSAVHSMTWNGWDISEQKRITKLMVRDGIWKYIHTPAHQRDELFRLDNDPLERQDLSQSDTGQLELMKARLRAEKEPLQEDGEPVQGISSRLIDQMRSMGYIE